MDFETFLTDFCSPEANRETLLLSALKKLEVVPRVLQLQGLKHIMVDPPVRSRPGARPVVFIAHYDRYPGSPGANDNSASVLNLLFLLEKMKKLGDRALWPEVRVIFTDGEEIYGNKKIQDQGSFQLGKFLKKTRLAQAFYCVLDLTGIGDTVVLGKGAKPHLDRAGIKPDETYQTMYSAQRLITKKVLANLHEGFFVEIDTPFSDDLGLFLAGIVASQLSLLPRKEAEVYRNRLYSDTPPSWQTIHSSLDEVSRLWEKSRKIVEEMLDLFLAYPIPTI